MGTDWEVEINLRQKIVTKPDQVVNKIFGTPPFIEMNESEIWLFHSHHIKSSFCRTIVIDKLNLFLTAV